MVWNTKTRITYTSTDFYCLNNRKNDMGNLTKVRGKQLTFDSLRLTSFCVKCQLLRNVLR